jgi:hypothetical protein
MPAPGPITYPLSGAAKWLVRVGAPALEWAHENLFTQSSDTEDETWEWRRLMVKFVRETPAGTVEDAAYCTFDVANFTGGTIDTSWVAGDYTACETRFDTFWNAVKVYFPATHVIKEYRWYRRQFAATQVMPDSNGRNGKLFEDSGPPVKVTPKTIAGTATAPAFPYQVACTVTELTAMPRHWGRWYIPGFCVALAADGRWPSGAVTAVATAAGTLMNGLTADQLPLVVPAAQVDNAPAKWLLNVTGMQVDDIPDIQRRRRPKQPLIRTVVAGA